MDSFERGWSYAMRYVCLLQDSLRLVQTVRNVSSCVFPHARICHSRLYVRSCGFISLISSFTFDELWCYKLFLFIKLCSRSKKTTVFRFDWISCISMSFPLNDCFLNALNWFIPINWIIFPPDSYKKYWNIEYFDRKCIFFISFTFAVARSTVVLSFRRWNSFSFTLFGKWLCLRFESP